MPSVHLNHVIKRPLITEKSTFEGSERGRYSFVVELYATKEQIRTAIAELYNVRVTKVRVQVRQGKTYRTKHGQGKDTDWKKAIVELHPDDKIDLF